MHHPAQHALHWAGQMDPIPKHLLGSIRQFSSPPHSGLPAVMGGAAEVSLAVAFPAQALETCRISMTKRRRAQRHLQPPRCLPAASRPLRLPGPVLLALPAGWAVTPCWEQLLEEGAPLVQHPEVLSWVSISPSPRGRSSCPGGGGGTAGSGLLVCFCQVAGDKCGWRRR